jgi:signal transduction histidine kinase
MKKSASAKSGSTIVDNLTESLNSSTIIEMADFMGVYYNIIDINGQYIYKNERFKNDFPELYKSCITAKEAWEDCKKVMQSGERSVLEEEYRGRHFLSVKRPIYAKDRCIGISIISHDITAQKKAEIAKMEFISSINHDMRTPFVGICQLSDMLLKDEKDEKKKKYLNMISESSKVLINYFNTILSYISTNSKEENVSFNMKQSVENIVKMFSPIITHKKLDIEINCPYSVINYNKIDFEKICLNLISNAIKFTEKGKITITAELNNKKPELKFSVGDTGIGIDKKHHEKIFDKFERVIPSYIEPEYKGCGMGLHIAKTLVEKMKGKISLESVINKGSTFSVYLPL